LKAYYAHSVYLYNTKQEERDLDLLRYLGFSIYNPNNEKDGEGYKNYGMNYFNSLIFNCDILVFRALPDGRIPAGVYNEILTAMKMGKTIIELPSNMLSRGMSVENTREFLKEVGNR